MSHHEWTVQRLEALEGDAMLLLVKERAELNDLAEQALDHYLEAIRLANPFGIGSNQQEAILNWSWLAFHIARAAFALAIRGYPLQATMLIRPLSDAIHLCWLFSRHSEYADQALAGKKLLSTAKIRTLLKEESWLGYQELHDYLHVRDKATRSYQIEDLRPDKVTFAWGPDEDLDKFGQLALEISIFVLGGCTFVASAWKGIRKDENWSERQARLVDRAMALGSPYFQDRQAEQGNRRTR